MRSPQEILVRVLIESDFLGDFSQIVRIFRVQKWILIFIFNLDENFRFFVHIKNVNI